MILLIPIGGIGSRFKQHQYSMPKALINIFGKPIICHLLDGLFQQQQQQHNHYLITTICIAYHADYALYRFEDMLRHMYPTFPFVFCPLSHETRGAAETIHLALHHMDGLTSFTMPDSPVLCVDSDNVFTTDIIQQWNGRDAVFTVNDETSAPIYSYVLSEHSIITNIKEKVKISNDACVGAYGFQSWKTLMQYTQCILDENRTDQGECYTSTVIQRMMEDQGHPFIHLSIPRESWICLGTPLQVRQFVNNCPRISCMTGQLKIESKRICFDLDNTLVTYPTVKGDYTTVEPIESMIEYARYLKQMGNTIIIATARNMKTNGSNVGATVAKIGKITLDTIETFRIPCDEIYFGKPHADFYIDDKAVQAFDLAHMEKEMGFYWDKVHPRDFNQLVPTTIDFMTKQSQSADASLAGEIYYYHHIPPPIKDLFPIMLSFANDYRQYTMEKIHGVTLTTLYVGQLLTTDQFMHVIKSLERIHVIKPSNQSPDQSPGQSPGPINMYANYATKLNERYAQFDYSMFPQSDTLYQSLLHDLQLYETNQCGQLCMIHGDAVFTNIMINTLDKIKFIDMRGRLGDTLTLFGDALYDWAKLYQSLIGYDAILQGKHKPKYNHNHNHSYERTMIGTFTEYIVNHYGQQTMQHIKLITKSLLFTLIPLHNPATNQDKCADYYQLIQSEWLQ